VYTHIYKQTHAYMHIFIICMYMYVHTHTHTNTQTHTEEELTWELLQWLASHVQQVTNKLKLLTN